MRVFDTMASRIFLILLLGVLLSAAATMAMALRDKYDAVMDARSRFIVEQVGETLASLDAMPLEQRYFDSHRPGVVLADVAPPSSAEPDAYLSRTLAAGLPSSRQASVWRIPAAECPEQRHFRFGCLLVKASLGDGTRVAMILPARQISILPPHAFFGYFGLFVLALALLAWLVAWLAARPLRVLAGAATALGRDIQRPPLPEKGPRELRDAAAAFNIMQARIRQNLKERTGMMGAIAHDLQTPLTRLRLRLEQLEDGGLRDTMARDLAAMESLIREGLELVRSQEPSEPPCTLDLDSLLEALVADARDMGQDVILEGSLGLPLFGRPQALRRLFGNLVDNAVQYAGSARLGVAKRGAWVEVRVSDDGPGIPEKHLGEATLPFFRLEASRSRHTGGTGLGLAIAHNIAENHGGSLALANREEGGLEATVRLPLA